MNECIGSDGDLERDESYATGAGASWESEQIRLNNGTYD
jgi:hypothetical protein